MCPCFRSSLNFWVNPKWSLSLPKIVPQLTTICFTNFNRTAMFSLLLLVTSTTFLWGAILKIKNSGLANPGKALQRRRSLSIKLETFPDASNFFRTFIHSVFKRCFEGINFLTRWLLGRSTHSIRWNRSDYHQ